MLIVRFGARVALCALLALGPSIPAVGQGGPQPIYTADAISKLFTGTGLTCFAGQVVASGTPQKVTLGEYTPPIGEYAQAARDEMLKDLAIGIKYMQKHCKGPIEDMSSHFNTLVFDPTTSKDKTVEKLRNFHLSLGQTWRRSPITIAGDNSASVITGSTTKEGRSYNVNIFHFGKYNTENWLTVYGPPTAVPIPNPAPSFIEQANMFARALSAAVTGGVAAAFTKDHLAKAVTADLCSETGLPYNANLSRPQSFMAWAGDAFNPAIQAVSARAMAQQIPQSSLDRALEELRKPSLDLVLSYCRRAAAPTGLWHVCFLGYLVEGPTPPDVMRVMYWAGVEVFKRKILSAREVPVEGLGEEASGVTGTFNLSSGELNHLVFYGWRTKNAALIVYGQGQVGSISTTIPESPIPSFLGGRTIKNLSERLGIKLTF